MGRKKKLPENLKKLKHFLINSWLVQAFFSLLKKIPVSKKHKITLYDAFYLFLLETKDKDIQSEANAVAFNFTLALFPGILFLFTLIPFLELSDYETDIYDFMHANLPTSMFDAIKSTIDTILHQKETGTLTVGFVLAFILSTNGMIGIMNAFNRMYKSRDTRGFIRKRLTAMGLTVAVVFVFIAAIAILVVGKYYLQLMIESSQTRFIIRSLEYFGFTLIFFFTVSLIYYFAPTVHKRWNFFSLGSLMATLIGVAATAAFFYYINRFNTYNKVYGSIGALIGVMVWIKVLSYVLLIGFEMNVGLDRHKLKILSGEKEKENS